MLMYNKSVISITIESIMCELNHLIDYIHIKKYINYIN